MNFHPDLIFIHAFTKQHHSFKVSSKPTQFHNKINPCWNCVLHWALTKLLQNALHCRNCICKSDVATCHYFSRERVIKFHHFNWRWALQISCSQSNKIVWRDFRSSDNSSLKRKKRELGKIDLKTRNAFKEKYIFRDWSNFLPFSLWHFVKRQFSHLQWIVLFGTVGLRPVDSANFTLRLLLQISMHIQLWSIL